MKTSTSIKTIFLLIFMALGTSVLLNSCKDDDPCDGVDCLNGGICNDGTCTCLIGYEGSNCGTEIRNKFLAAYNCTNTCFPGTSYSSSASPSAVDVSKFIITNMGNVGGLDVVAKATGGTIFVIENQTVTDNDGDSWTMSGQGSLVGNVITANITYVYNPNQNTFTCTESWVKQ